MPMRPPVHRPHPPGEAKKDYERWRGSPSSRGYDGRWRRFRLMVLAENPLCADCLEGGVYTTATEPHHLLKVRDRPDLLLEPSNVRCLCRPCHSTRTARGE